MRAQDDQIPEEAEEAEHPWVDSIVTLILAVGFFVAFLVIAAMWTPTH